MAKITIALKQFNLSVKMKILSDQIPKSIPTISKLLRLMKILWKLSPVSESSCHQIDSHLVTDAVSPSKVNIVNSLMKFLSLLYLDSSNFPVSLALLFGFLSLSYLDFSLFLFGFLSLSYLDFSTKKEQ